LAELCACYIVYSRKYLKNILKNNSLQNKSIFSELKTINTVLDLGCGISYTTAALKEIFPWAQVFGLDLDGSFQIEFAKRISKKYKYKIIHNYDIVHNVDLIFASEFFEHIHQPIEYLEKLIQRCMPKYMLIANAFNSRAIGHFESYVYGQKKYSGKQISKIFNSFMRELGYIKIKTTLWNNRPAFWKKGNYCE
jgi:SAM-dependent methyltransferase